jgi:hypothetical protein
VETLKEGSIMKANRSLELSEIRNLEEVNADPESDLDLAVIPSVSSVKKKKLDILEDLAIHGYCNVDLVFIDEDNLVLAYEAIRQNCLIYAVKDFDRGTTYSNIVRKYLDFEFYLRIQRNAYKQRNISAKT